MPVCVDCNQKPVAADGDSCLFCMNATAFQLEQLRRARWMFDQSQKAAKCFAHEIGFNMVCIHCGADQRFIDAYRISFDIAEAYLYALDAIFKDQRILKVVREQDTRYKLVCVPNKANHEHTRRTQKSPKKTGQHGSR